MYTFSNARVCFVGVVFVCVVWVVYQCVCTEFALIDGGVLFSFFRNKVCDCHRASNNCFGLCLVCVGCISCRLSGSVRGLSALMNRYVPVWMFH